jgi:leucyl-tRNA synthetase
MEYQFNAIEKKWQDHWKSKNAYRVSNHENKPTCYVLDMFPYPSGAGLHVGHPLGYIASDIYSRYKRLKGFNVLHPMGFDSFGLPAEQYAIETGQHPADTTEKNIATFKNQLDKIGFCYDWEREVRTSDPEYYRWTQWIFLQLFNSWFNPVKQKAEPIEQLIRQFETTGTNGTGKHGPHHFSAEHWKQMSPENQADILMDYRLAFSAIGEVNWCEALGTVLANDEVVNGVSERGGHPVVKKKMRQWYLRITEYADRLLDGLEKVDFSESMKEMQRNWIGKSEGCEIDFCVDGLELNGNPATIKVFTTRPDTIFGADFLVLAPEHSLVTSLISESQRKSTNDYIDYVKSRSDRERIAEVKQITGCFTGAYAIHPFTLQKIPIWIAEYVLAGYGTGAIMAVPCGDQRDYLFANHFNIPVTNIFGSNFDGLHAQSHKDLPLEESDFLNGISNTKQAVDLVISRIEAAGLGKRKVNYKMHDAGFSRQRYWGEPFPIQWKNSIATALHENHLPLQLPHVEKYGPGPEGQGPLANIPEWLDNNLETSTMPGYAGSSWYFLRYMDPKNNQTFCDRTVSDYWGPVDVYVGGTEHAVGHLLYSRMWTKVLFDLGYIKFDEPFKKLVNQGMIQGSSRFAYRIKGTNTFVSAGLKNEYETDQIHVDVHFVDGLILDTIAFKNWKPDLSDATFILENNQYICGAEVEKMSKSKFNTVNPDELVAKYGADTFRMYEMFLGPIEQSKPWDTQGIEGVHRFLKKLIRLMYNDKQEAIWSDTTPTEASLKTLHRTIKKIDQDTSNFSFNTAVSAFMVCVNELTEQKGNQRSILESILIMLAPYAPHLCEELWMRLGNSTSILDAAFPSFEEKYLIESEKEYPVSINGKVRTNILLPMDATETAVESAVFANEIVQKWLEGKPAKKLIFVKGKMINVVV